MKTSFSSHCLTFTFKINFFFFTKQIKIVKLFDHKNADDENRNRSFDSRFPRREKCFFRNWLELKMIKTFWYLRCCKRSYKTGRLWISTLSTVFVAFRDDCVCFRAICGIRELICGSRREYFEFDRMRGEKVTVKLFWSISEWLFYRIRLWWFFLIWKI